MILPLLLAAAPLSCAIEQAHYALRTDPNVTISVQRIRPDDDAPSGIALRMQVATSGHIYWWLPQDGGSNAMQSLSSTTDPNQPGWRSDGPSPLGTVDFISADADYTINNHVPRAGEKAPAHMFISDLREALWYRTQPMERDGTARQFFDFVRCGG